MHRLTTLIGVYLLLCCGCICSISDAQSDVRKDDPKPNRALNSPLLRGLQQSLNDSQAVGESGSSDVLLDQLQQADDLLTDARLLNRVAFRHINRQQRIGAAALSPHILLISVDRLGWGDLGCYGQKEIQTPNMDSLAKDGMKFNRYYAGHANNSAARWCLQTGRTGWDHKRGKENRFVLGSSEESLAGLLWDSGYLTTFLGYWGNGDRPSNHGYESWSGFVDHEQAIEQYPEKIQVDSTSVRIVGNKDNKKTVTANAMLSSELTSWFQHHRQTRRQFFVHFHVSAFADLSDSSAESAVQLSASDYQHRIESADKTVGTILKTLVKIGVTRRTMVVLLAQSGPHLRCQKAVAELNSSAGLKLDESQLAEGNLRVPMIVRWPRKISAGSTTDHLCSACDIVPTFLATAIGKGKPKTDGLSFGPTLTGSKQAEHQILYWESGHKKIGQAARRGNWKAIRESGSRSVKLYDLSKDQGEAKDVANEYPKILATLIKK
jgi:arylsulfatase A